MMGRVFLELMISQTAKPWESLLKTTICCWFWGSPFFCTSISSEIPEVSSNGFLIFSRHLNPTRSKKYIEVLTASFPC